MLFHAFRKKIAVAISFSILVTQMNYWFPWLSSENWWVHFATESFKFKGNVSFFTDYKHTILNGTTNSISAARRYDKLLLDPNNNYVLRGKKHSCYENFAVFLRLRSKIRKLKSHQNYFCSLGAKLKFRKSFLTKMQN